MKTLYESTKRICAKCQTPRPQPGSVKSADGTRWYCAECAKAKGLEQKPRRSHKPEGNKS